MMMIIPDESKNAESTRGDGNTRAHSRLSAYERSEGWEREQFVQAIFCFSLPTALAEYSRAILGANVN